MLNQRLFAALLAVTTVTTSITVNTPSSYAACRICPAQKARQFYQWVIKNGERVRVLVTTAGSAASVCNLSDRCKKAVNGNRKTSKSYKVENASTVSMLKY